MCYEEYEVSSEYTNNETSAISPLAFQDFKWQGYLQAHSGRGVSEQVDRDNLMLTVHGSIVFG